MTDDITPTRVVNALPAISGEAYQHVGRFAGAVVLSVFEQNGGVEAMSAWALSNQSDFYTKLFGKLVAKSMQVDHSGSISIDDAISRLERSGNIVEGDFTENFDL